MLISFLITLAVLGGIAALFYLLPIPPLFKSVAWVVIGIALIVWVLENIHGLVHGGVHI